MTKIALAALLISVSASSFAATETCEQYFTAVDTFIAEASKHEEAKAQVATLKTQLAESKKQLEAYPAEQQDAGCKQGLDAMTKLSAALGIK